MAYASPQVAELMAQRSALRFLGPLFALPFDQLKADHQLDVGRLIENDFGGTSAIKHFTNAQQERMQNPRDAF